MLRDLDAQFPGDAEILHMHDAVLQDQQEQEKSARLAEARKPVAKQHFDGALSILSGLVQIHPEDSAIKSFRSLVLQQKEGEARQKQTSTELQKLRALLENGKLVLVLKNGQQVAPLVSLIVRAGGEVQEVRSGQGSLEDVFLTMMEEER